MMRGVVGLVIVSMWLSVPVQAQATKKARTPRLTMGGGSAPLHNLLRVPAVQKELQLRPEQMKQLEALERKGEDLREKYQAAVASLGDNPDPQAFRQLRAEQVGTLTQVWKEVDASSAKVLDRDQRARAFQIDLQYQGARAFLDPDFQGKMNLTPEQIDEITTLVRQGSMRRRERDELRSEAIGNATTREVKIDEFGRAIRQVDPAKKDALQAQLKEFTKADDQSYRSVEQSLRKLLTKRQRARYEAMLGKPFDPDKSAETAKKAETPHASDASK